MKRIAACGARLPAGKPGHEIVDRVCHDRQTFTKHLFVWDVEFRDGEILEQRRVATLGVKETRLPLREAKQQGRAFVWSRDVRINGDVGEFLAMWQRWRDWYRDGVALTERAGRPYVEMSYIGEIAPPDPVTLTAIEGKLRQLGVASGIYGGPVGPPINRQDRSQSYAARC